MRDSSLKHSAPPGSAEVDNVFNVLIGVVFILLAGCWLGGGSWPAGSCWPEPSLPA